jgi:hypothetical protein
MKHTFDLTLNFEHFEEEDFENILFILRKLDYPENDFLLECIEDHLGFNDDVVEYIIVDNRKQTNK